MDYLNVAILDLYNGTPNQGMRNIKQIIESQPVLGETALRYEVFDVRAKNEIPLVSDFDIFVSSGGPGSPFEGLGSQWETLYFEWLEALWQHNLHHDHKKFAFFICHSFQMICRHFKVGAVTQRKSVSFGVFPVHQTREGIEDMYFQCLPEPFYVVDNRNWQVISPDYARLEDLGAKILSLEKIRPHIDLERAVMAIRFSPEIFAVQFHPEADREGMLHYLLSEDKRQEIITLHGEEKYHQMLDYLQHPEKISLTRETVLPNFLSHAMAELLAVNSFGG